MQWIEAVDVMLEGIPEKTLVAEEDAITDLFLHRFENHVSYHEFLNDLNTYSETPMPEDLRSRHIDTDTYYILSVLTGKMQERGYTAYAEEAQETAKLSV